MNWIGSLVGTIFLTATASAAEVQIRNSDGEDTIIYRSSHALVIGAADYESRSWNDLHRVPEEIEEVITVLQTQGFQVESLLNPDAQQLRAAIRNFITDYGTRTNNIENRLLIFFSGHGHTRLNDRGYLVPVDAPDPYQDEAGFLRKAYDMADMINWARKIEAKHALFVFDSCFSGTLFQRRSQPSPSEVYIRDRTAKPVRQFITAGSADQEVPAKSIFTPLFIRGLEGDADLNGDDYVTGAELGLFLETTLPDYNPAQTPQYGKIRDVALDAGDFVFRVVPQRSTDVDPQGIADLVIEITGPKQIRLGQEPLDRVNLLVGNRGSGPALGTLEADRGGYMIDLVLSKDEDLPAGYASFSDTFSEDVLIRGGRVSRTQTLAPNKSIAYYLRARIPSDTPPGIYCLGAVVDPGHNINETNETNNDDCYSIEVVR